MRKVPGIFLCCQKLLNGEHKDLRRIIAAIKAGQPETLLARMLIPTWLKAKVFSNEIHTVRILHFEDDGLVASMVRRCLRVKAGRVETCADGNVALEKISGEDEYNLLVDYDLPGVNGVEIVNRARELDHRCDTPMGRQKHNRPDMSARPSRRSAIQHGNFH